MELVLFIVALFLTGTIAYFVCCSLYFLFTDRPFSLAIKLSPKLAAVTIVGAPIFGFMGILLATLWFNAALEPLPSYHKWRDIAVGAIIAIACTALLFFAVLGLAWEIFE